MKFLKVIFLVVSLFIFLSCEDLHWTDEDILKEKKEETTKRKFSNNLL
ncbi:MAG: hypothetical protein OXJ52_09360 [Oligoflexia bacterium]|nr:hypothetical protein [Oligoflexia bacterium]